MMRAQIVHLLLCVSGAMVIALHFLAYVALLRDSGHVRTERPIFLYHCASAVGLSLVALTVAAAFPSEEAFATALSIVFAHGIYSLTFLEFWTLAQISFSKDVLAEVVRNPGVPRAPLVDRMAAVGDAKRAGRLESLDRLGLLSGNGGRRTLTVHGRIVALFLRALLWLPNSRHHG